MSEFQINTSLASNCTTIFEKIDQKLQSAGSDLNSIKHRFNGTSSIGRIDERINEGVELIEQNKALANSIRNVLVQCIELYRNTESGIVGQCDFSGLQQRNDGINNNLSEHQKEIVDFASDPKNAIIFYSFMQLPQSVLLGISNLDKILITFRNGDDIFTENIISGIDYSQQLLRSELAKLLAKAAKNSEVETIPDEVKHVLGLIAKGEKLPEKLAEKYGVLISGAEKLSKVSGKTNDVLEFCEYVLTDYSKSLELMDSLRATGANDPGMTEAMNYLTAMYKDKYLGSVYEVVNNYEKEILSSGGKKLADLATGGLYTIVDLGKDVAFDVTGLSERVNSIETLTASTVFGKDIQNSYFGAMDKIRSGNYNSADISNVENTFSLFKSNLIQQYESAIKITRDSAVKKSLMEGAKKLNTISMVDMGAFGGGSMGGRGIDTAMGGR